MAASTLQRLTVRSAAAAILTGLVWLGCSRDASDLTGPRSDQLAVLQQLLGPAMAVQDRHTPDLMETPGVVGTAVALGANGEPVIRIYAARRGIEGLPAQLEGIPVNVEVTGLILARTDPTKKQPRPVPTGVSVGHPAITAGTICCRVKDALGNLYILSNNHVLADANDANLGDPLIQPGAFDGGSAPADQIGILDSFQPINFQGGNNTIDAALGLTSASDLSNSTPADDGYGTPASEIFGDSDADGYFDNTSALLNLGVKKYGRTTKLTEGTITEINATIAVCYEALYGIFCLKQATFVDQIGISPGTFSGGGDSGSFVVEALTNQGVGLLFAGSETRTFANRIDLVLKNFGVFVDGDAPGPITDIAVTDVSAPESATEGDPVTVEVSVRNSGNQDVGNDIVVTLTDESDGAPVLSQTVSGGLTAGESTTLSYEWNTAGESYSEHTLTASQSYADDNPGNDSRSTVVTILDPSGPPPGMHVGDLWQMATQENKKSWSAYVIVTIHDASHEPLEGATVYGAWTGTGLGSDECVTDYAGECLMLQTLIHRRSKSVTFTVTDVVFGSEPYQSTTNHDDDGDSDGTSITVPRPF